MCNIEKCFDSAAKCRTPHTEPLRASSDAKCMHCVSSDEGPFSSCFTPALLAHLWVRFAVQELQLLLKLQYLM